MQYLVLLDTDNVEAEVPAISIEEYFEKKISFEQLSNIFPDPTPTKQMIADRKTFTIARIKQLKENMAIAALGRLLSSHSTVIKIDSIH